MNHTQLTDQERRKLNRERIANDTVKQTTSKSVKRRKTRRAKKKKPQWQVDLDKKREEERQLHNRQKKQRWEMYQEFRRKIAE